MAQGLRHHHDYYGINGFLLGRVYLFILWKNPVYIFRSRYPLCLQDATPRADMPTLRSMREWNLVHVVTERLLDAIVFLVAVGLRVISQFGYEMHGAKVRR